MTINIKANYGKKSIQLSPEAQINSRGELMLYGAIGNWFDDLDAQTVVNEIDAMSGDEIVVRFHSPGGNILEGLAMYNALKGTKKRVIGYIDGIAASMACAIAMACDEVRIPSNALMMMHKPNLSDLRGQYNANDLREIAEQLDQFEPSYIQLHSDKTGKSIEEIAEILSDGKNHFYRGQEAIDFGLADTLIDEITVAASWNEFDVAKAQYLNVSKNAAAVAPQKPQEQDMLFNLNVTGGSPNAAIVITALSAAFSTVEDASANLGYSIDTLKGEKAISEDALVDIATKINCALPQDVNAMRRAEAKRVADIYDVCAKGGIDDETREKWIKENVSVDSARAQAFEKFAENQNSQLPGSGSIRTGGTRNIAMDAAQALLVRAVPDQYQHTEHSGEFRSLSLIETMKAVLEHQGQSVRGKSQNDIIAMAMHTTSDFQHIVQDVANKELLRTYNAKPATYTAISRETSARDFKDKHSVQLGKGSELDTVNEKGEYKAGTISDAGESFKVRKFGRIFNLSYELMVNDDLGAIMTFLQTVGSKAKTLEQKIVWELIAGNPSLSDGNPFFSATASHKRNNLITGTAIEPAIEAAVLAMSKQKDLDGEEIDLSPSILVVPPERFVEARKVLSAIQATSTNDVNVFANALEIVKESRIRATNNPFYFFADKSEAPAVEHAFLDGQREPLVETRNSFETDGLSIKIRHIFGAGLIDFRPAVKCTGAA